jgi:hypothetical protein
VTRARLGIAATIAGLIVVMAAIAGRSERLFGPWDIALHGVLGNIVFTLALVAVVLAFVARASTAARVTSVAFLLLAFAQVGLGYVGRETLDAAAWHVPNGVLLMGLAAFQLSEFIRIRPAG